MYNGPIPDYPRQPWSVFFTAENREKCTAEALDLLTSLLQYDHQVGRRRKNEREEAADGEGGDGASVF